MITFNQDLLFGMFAHASERILEQVPHLNELDGQTGDGDHGTTMLRVCHCIEEFMQHPASGDWSKQVDELGWTIMGQDGGSAGMLIGNLFIGIGSGLVEPELSPSQIAATFRAGLDRMIQFSGAHQGDKTMLDALIPAIETLETYADNGAGVDQMFQAASHAAEQGCQATIEMVPTRGRAKNMGEKAIGYVDPGATSMALLFESFTQYIEQLRG
ncbi:DAK2 domain-containing protein [Vibrio algarum]|uniref:DAK2 domain-containing protein n=1 Tax=Vibrio algarum TaxID=3020714 RepID=A0ABT4YWD7_9VIBR|nr:DAK2 domain-containing protein [Vibrio sp. KJ40-1]MDB1125785.1 DAK2 domain-containing protein [Vibrio sp. KJ40-1]